MVEFDWRNWHSQNQPEPDTTAIEGQYFDPYGNNVPEEAVRLKDILQGFKDSLLAVSVVNLIFQDEGPVPAEAAIFWNMNDHVGKYDLRIGQSYEMPVEADSEGEAKKESVHYTIYPNNIGSYQTDEATLYPNGVVHGIVRASRAILPQDVPAMNTLRDKILKHVGSNTLMNEQSNI